MFFRKSIFQWLSHFTLLHTRTTWLKTQITMTLLFWKLFTYWWRMLACFTKANLSTYLFYFQNGNETEIHLWWTKRERHQWMTKAWTSNSTIFIFKLVCAFWESHAQDNVCKFFKNATNHCAQKTLYCIDQIIYKLFSTWSKL